MDGDPISQVREFALIDAPVGVVWRLVTDVGRHPEFAGPKSITKAIEYEGPSCRALDGWPTRSSDRMSSMRPPRSRAP